MTAKWIVQAVKAIRNGLAQKLEKGGVTVYKCPNIIRIDVKDNVELEEEK